MDWFLDDDDRARYLREQSREQAAAGRTKEALESALAAVALLRTLAGTDPSDWFGLAMALIDLSDRHGVVGDLDEAVIALAEAVEILRRLEPNIERAITELAWALTTELAAALLNLADGQLRLRRPEKALDPALEAAARSRALCGTNLHGFRHELAGSLETLGACQTLLGQAEEAREAMREAVATYEELAAASPEAFTDKLAAARERLALLSAQQT